MYHFSLKASPAVQLDRLGVRPMSPSDQFASFDVHGSFFADVVPNDTGCGFDLVCVGGGAFGSTVFAKLYGLPNCRQLPACSKCRRCPCWRTSRCATSSAGGALDAVWLQADADAADERSLCRMAIPCPDALLDLDAVEPMALVHWCLDRSALEAFQFARTSPMKLRSVRKRKCVGCSDRPALLHSPKGWCCLNDACMNHVAGDGAAKEADGAAKEAGGAAKEAGGAAEEAGGAAEEAGGAAEEDGAAKETDGPSINTTTSRLWQRRSTST